MCRIYVRISYDCITTSNVLVMFVVLELDKYIEAKSAEGVQKVCECAVPYRIIDNFCR